MGAEAGQAQVAGGVVLRAVSAGQRDGRLRSGGGQRRGQGAGQAGEVEQPAGVGAGVAVQDPIHLVGDGPQQPPQPRQVDGHGRHRQREQPLHHAFRRVGESRGRHAFEELPRRGGDLRPAARGARLLRRRRVGRVFQDAAAALLEGEDGRDDPALMQRFRGRGQHFIEQGASRLLAGDRRQSRLNLVPGYSDRQSRARLDLDFHPAPNRGQRLPHDRLASPLLQVVEFQAEQRLRGRMKDEG